MLVSGTGPVQPDGGCPQDTLGQARRCWEIVLAALAEAGASAEHVIRTRTFLTPEADAEQAMQAHGEVFKDVRPAATMLAVHSLLDPRWTVEVEAAKRSRSSTEGSSPPKPGVRTSWIGCSGDVEST